VSHHVYKILGVPGNDSDIDCAIRVKKLDESDIKPFLLETYGIAVPKETRMLRHFP
jgi:hypothetical protein